MRRLFASQPNASTRCSGSIAGDVRLADEEIVVESTERAGHTRARGGSSPLRYLTQYLMLRKRLSARALVMLYTPHLK